jgi:hypothetical protein
MPTETDWQDPFAPACSPFPLAAQHDLGAASVVTVLAVVVVVIADVAAPVRVALQQEDLAPSGEHAFAGAAASCATTVASLALTACGAAVCAISPKLKNESMRNATKNFFIVVFLNINYLGIRAITV